MQIRMHAKAGMRSLIEIASHSDEPLDIHGTDSSFIEMHATISTCGLCFLMIDSL